MSEPQPRKVVHLPKVRMLSRGGRLSSGLRITNVKSIKPPDPEAVKKQEENKLRAQLQKEIVSRSRKCAHKGFECTLPVLAGRQYCRRHILRDPTAPYRQCTHTYGNGERCPLPAPIEQRDLRDPGLCFEHARLAMLARQKSAAPPPPAHTTETLLNQLQHYVKPERPRTTSCASSVSVVSDPSDQELGSPQAVDPFKQIDATAVNAAFSSSIMECGSGSDSECDSVTLGEGGTCRGGHEYDLSDAEDAPCEELPLWRAGVYTAEEAVSEAKNCLKNLQAAYFRQLSRLRVLLQNARLKYLRELKAEKEQYSSISAQVRSGPQEARVRRQLRKLKAYAGYHRRHGVDAIMARKLQHRRAKANDMHPSRPLPSLARCTFAEGGVRCSVAALPAARHCLKHILHDGNQVLFSACGDVRGATSCREPVARLPLASDACRYHTNPPLYTVFTVKMPTNSDSETETSSEESHIDAELTLPPQPVEEEKEILPEPILPLDVMQYE